MKAVAHRSQRTQHSHRRRRRCQMRCVLQDRLADSRPLLKLRTGWVQKRRRRRHRQKDSEERSHGRWSRRDSDCAVPVHVCPLHSLTLCAQCCLCARRKYLSAPSARAKCQRAPAQVNTGRRKTIIIDVITSQPRTSHMYCTTCESLVRAPPARLPFQHSMILPSNDVVRFVASMNQLS